MKCPICNGENKENAIICQFCGEKVDSISEVNIRFENEDTGPKVCLVCNKGNKKDALLCEFCGEKFNSDITIEVNEDDNEEDIYYIDFNERKSSKIKLFVGIFISIIAVISVVVLFKQKR